MHVCGRSQDGARGRSAFSKVALGGSLLVNVALLSYYASHRNDSGRTSLLATGQDLAIKSTLSSLEQKITVTSSSKPPSPNRKGKTVYDVAVNAEVDSALTQGLGVANSLQVARLVKREQALWASDAKLAKRTTAGGNVRLPSQQPEHQAYEAHFEWGTVNPVSGLQRLTCSDSLADASGNDAPKNRFWGGPFAGKSGVVVDSCAPGKACNDPCARSACNVGEIYTVECPNNCLKQELGGSVFGQGTPQNPFMDLSSVCRAALAAGLKTHTHSLAFSLSHTHTHTNKHTHTHTHMYTLTHTHTHTHTYIDIHTNTHNRYTHTHTHIHTHPHTLSLSHTHTYICVCTHSNTHKCIHTDTHTHL